MTRRYDDVIIVDEMERRKEKKQRDTVNLPDCAPLCKTSFLNYVSAISCLTGMKCMKYNERGGTTIELYKEM